MAEWRFQRRQGLCADCGHAFEEGETLFSLLRLDQDELSRGDLCSPCFEQRDAELDVIFWRTRHSEKRGGIRVDFEQLFAALQSLSKSRRPEHLDFRFLLALLLVRHRKLRLLTVRRKGKVERLVLRRPRSQKEFEVTVRELDPERRARISAALTELLDPTREGGFDKLVPDAGDARAGDSTAGDSRDSAA